MLGDRGQGHLSLWFLPHSSLPQGTFDSSPETNGRMTWFEFHEVSATSVEVLMSSACQEASNRQAGFPAGGAGGASVGWGQRTALKLQGDTASSRTS